MPRRPHVDLVDLPLRIVLRGRTRRACLLAEDVYYAYRNWLGQALKSTSCRLHAFVQMTKHVHLLLTPPTAVPTLLISLCRRYDRLLFVFQEFWRMSTFFPHLLPHWARTRPQDLRIHRH